MAEEASHQLARKVVAKVCQPLGWQGMQNGACDVLADLLKRYVITLGRTTAAYVSNANRTDATLDDVAYAFEDLGISIDDLFAYSRLVDSAPLPTLPHFPLPQQSTHIYSTPSAPPTTKPRPSISEEDEEGEEDGDIIPPYFPPLPSKKMDDEEDDAESGVHDSVEREGSVEPAEALPTPGDPLRGLPQMFRSRSRLSSEISEEGDGSSRRGSFSDASGPGLNQTRGVPEPATAGGGVMSGGGVPNPLENSNSATDSLRISADDSSMHVAGVDDGSRTKTSTASPSTEIMEPGSSLVSESASPPEREVKDGVREAPFPSRPPPLRLMSGGPLDPLPIISPLLPSPLPGGVRPSLPLLSPLSATPTPPNPPSRIPLISTPTTKSVLPTPPQLVPTTEPTEHQDSAQPHETPPPTTKKSETEKETAIHSESSAESAHSAELISAADTKLPSLHHSVVTEDTEDQKSESFTHSAVRETTEVELKREEEENLSDEDVSPSPEETPNQAPLEGGATDPSVFPPLTLSREATPTNSATRSPPVREKPDIPPEEEEEVGDGGDNDSVISSVSSKTSFGPVEEPEKPETETGFSLVLLSTTEEETAQLMEQVRRPSREVSIDDINTEGGGEGGVACILDGGEEEMNIPDIDKQLELSESEESSSSGSSSASEAEPPEKEPGGLGVREKEGREMLFLEPPQVGVRSSSHSVASTPSVSPSPSPIPGSHSGTSHHSVPVPVESPAIDPYLKPSSQSVVQKDVAKSTRHISSTDSRPVAGSLVVTIKTNLVPSLREVSGRGRGREGSGGKTKGRRKDPPSRADVQKDPEKRQKKRFVPSQRVAAAPVVAKIKIEPLAPPPPPPPLIVCIKRSLLHQESPVETTSDLLPQPEYEEDEEDDDDVIVTKSAERDKAEGSKGWFSGQGSQYLAPEGSAQTQGVWRRELDISEMGLVAQPPPPPPPSSHETQQVRIIPQSSSSSSSGESDSDSESSSPSPLPHPPPHTLPPGHTLSPAPSPWQRPIRSEDEESTSSSATGGGGGLKLKLKISKALLQGMPLGHQLPGKQSSGKPDKKHRKKGSATADSMATTSQGGREGGSRKRGRSNKTSQKSGRKRGSNIPQIKLPKLELSALPGTSLWQQSTPRSERGAELFPPLKLPGVAVSPGGEVWFCPHCSKPDDGSPMIGCDGSCEGWYHWYCVGITQAPPENERWFCPSCARKGKKKSRRRRN